MGLIGFTRYNDDVDSNDMKIPTFKAGRVYISYLITRECDPFIEKGLWMMAN